MPRDRHSRKTYRVRQIPSHVSKESLAAFLSTICKALGQEDDILVYSLASSLVPFENPRTKTATVTFKNLPAIFDDDDNEWVVRTPERQPNIIVDVHFLGFTALNDVDSDLHALDCISISGLASHPFGSWADRNSQSNFMWLRDQLPQDIKHVRSIIYGYDTHLLQSESFQEIEDVAITLIAQLNVIGRSLKSAKPCFILAHSLGGIVLKCAMLEMANSGVTERSMLDSIREVILFGVPNKGMEMSHWLPMVKGQPNEPLIRLLAPGSPYLIDLDERFMGISAIRNLRLISFYETGRSQTAAQNSLTQKWEMTGSYKVLVDKTSAVQRGSRKPDMIPINQSHSDMVKFREGSADYQRVAKYIHDLVKTLVNQLSKAPLTQSSDVDIDIKLANAVLASLNVGETTNRFKSIEEAYTHTFEWIWTAPDVGFQLWLAQRTGIYWIGGKPGSGKSTLMKYIFKNYQERRSPRIHNSDETQICAGFFFHNRGSHLQKSFEGLLLGILHQILDSEPRLIQEVIPIYSRRHKSLREHWPVEDLEKALDCILNQNKISVDLLLFLDALDEYGGGPDYIARFVKNMVDPCRSSGTRVRICFSSRLWNVFIDQFQSYPGFKIHERTQTDILAYINGKFSENSSMAGLLNLESDAVGYEVADLTSSLIRGAEGVFLWLKLVMEDLLNESTEGATIAEVLKILDSLPIELEELYKLLVQRIPKSFRMEAYAMLEIVLRSGTPLSPYDFWLAIECAPCQTLESCVAKIPGKPYLAAHHWSNPYTSYPESQDRAIDDIEDENTIGMDEQQVRRLKSRCGGLIEFSSPTSENSNQGYILQFMHQTVKDFVSKPGFYQLVTNESHRSNENGYSFLSKYGLAQLTVERRRHAIPGYKPLPQFARCLPEWFSYLHYFARAESTTGVSQQYLLDAAHQAFAPAKDKDDVYGLYGSAMSFGVATNLQLYVEDKLRDTDPRLLAKVLQQTEQDIPSLLYTTVRATTQNDSYNAAFIPKQIFTKKLSPVGKIDYGHMNDGEVLFDDLAQMASILFRYGANQNCLYQQLTPFQWLFLECIEGYHSGNNIIPYPIVDMVRTFLENKQDPNTDIWGRSLGSMGKDPFLCKPLHIADSALATVLLDHNADVNAKDGQGLTALDIAFGAVGNIYMIGDHVKPEEGYALPLLLLEHGGCVTRRGMAKHTDFLKALTRHVQFPLDSLDERVKNPPLLAKPKRSPPNWTKNRSIPYLKRIFGSTFDHQDRS